MEHKKRNITGLTFLILGIVVLVIGIIAINNTDMSKYGTSHSGELETFTEEFSADGIENIKIDLGENDYSIIFDENAANITVHAEDLYKDSYTVKKEDGTFKIETKDHTYKFWKFNFHFINIDYSKFNDIHSITDLGKLFDSYDGKVTVTFPARLYDEVKLSSGVGDVYISGCECKEFDLSAGVGNVDLENVKADSSRFSAGMGNIDGKDIDFESFNLSAGVGNVDLSGFVGDTKISCGVGDVIMHIKNDSHNYDIDEDEADIHTGGKETSDKKYDMKISSGIGDCDIYFE